VGERVCTLFCQLALEIQHFGAEKRPANSPQHCFADAAAGWGLGWARKLENNNFRSIEFQGEPTVRGVCSVVAAGQRCVGGGSGCGKLGDWAKTKEEN